MRLSDTFNSEGNLLLKMCFSLGLSDPDLWPADFNLCQVKVLYCFHVNGLDAGTDVQRKNLKTAFVLLVSPLMCPNLKLIQIKIEDKKHKGETVRATCKAVTAAGNWWCWFWSRYWWWCMTMIRLSFFSFFGCRGKVFKHYFSFISS